MAILRNISADVIGTDNGQGRQVSCGPDETIEVTDARAQEVAADDRYWTVVESAPEVPAEPPTPPAEPPAAP